MSVPIRIHLPASDHGPRCAHCGESPHPLNACPAALSFGEMRAQFLATRKALAEAQEELAGWRQAAQDLGVSEPHHLVDVLLTKDATESLEKIYNLTPPSTHEHPH